MPVSLWRIATETREFAANDLSGRGAAKHPGRWNAEGERVVYAARTLSLAVLETAAYLRAGALPLNRFVVRIDVPDRVFDRRTELAAAKLDPAWRAIPAGKASVDIGSAWYAAGRTALLLAPSAIVPEECAVLINATHPDAAALTATTVRPFEFSNLFR